MARRIRLALIGGVVAAAAWVLWSCADPRGDDAATAVTECNLDALAKDPQSPQATVRAFVFAAEALRTRAAEAEAALKDACNEANAKLGFPAGTTATQACQGIADRGAKVKEREIAFPIQWPWFKGRFPSFCSKDKTKRASCIASCGGTCDVSANCEKGAQAGECDAKCTGTCETRDGACRGRCEGKCDSVTNGICDGECGPTCGTPYYIASCSTGCATGFFGLCEGVCVGDCDGKSTGNQPTQDAGADDGGVDGGDAGPPPAPGVPGNCGGFCVGSCLGGRAEGSCESRCTGEHRGLCDIQAGGRCTGTCTSGSASSCASTCSGRCSTSMKDGSCSGTCVGECSAAMTDVECRGELKCEANIECLNACAAQEAATTQCEETPHFYVSAITDPQLYEALKASGAKLGKAIALMDALAAGASAVAERAGGDFVVIGAKDELSRVCVARGIAANDEAQESLRAVLAARPIR